MIICARCGHSAGAHCEGRQTHTGWKAHTKPFRCVSRHCLEPLCSCVDLVTPAEEIAAEVQVA